MIDGISERLEEQALNAINDIPGILTESIRDPYSILVYTEDTDLLEVVETHELPLRYPCSGRNALWNFESFGRVVADKALLYRKNGGTICLAIPAVLSLTGFSRCGMPTRKHPLSPPQVGAQSGWTKAVLPDPPVPATAAGESKGP